LNFDGFVKSRILPLFVIPMKMGIQYFQTVTQFMDSRLRGNDDFLRVHQLCLEVKKLISNEFIGVQKVKKLIINTDH